MVFVVITLKFVGRRDIASKLVIIHQRWILSTKQQINVSSLPHLWPSGDQVPASGADDRRVVRVAPLHKLIIISLGITSQYYPSPDTNQKPPTLHPNISHPLTVLFNRHFNCKAKIDTVASRNRVTKLLGEGSWQFLLHLDRQSWNFND